MDVGGWLRKLGLLEYEATFRENKIDDTVLPSLTAEDLKDLGVGLVGHRRKLLDAIAALRAEASSDAPPTDKASKDTAERRQVTVMFSDLVGSTALSSRLDPEDMRKVISAYQRCVADTARRLGGFVAKYMGDGVLLYFGYPAAHESDAERAIRVGLALIDAVARLSAPEPLQVRIGAATGLVVVGDLLGSGKGQDHDIVGETPNLAARLQGMAEPNTLVISEATRRLVGNLFELQDLGPKAVKGIAGPVRAFAVLRASSVESRFEAMHPGGVTELIGRDQELALLLERWRLARAGEGQGVMLVGEAGIGKSRILRALVDRLRGEPHIRLQYQCSPYHADSAFWPVTQQLAHAAGFEAGDTPERRLDRLEALLTQARKEAIADAPLIAMLMGIDGAMRYGPLALAPAALRSRTLQALVNQVLGLAARDPVVMVMEDAHWIDPTTLELMERVLDAVANAPVLVVLTSRPDNQPGLAARAQPAEPRWGGGDRRRARGREATGSDRGGDRVARRRRTAVRGGADQGGRRKRREQRAVDAVRHLDGQARPYARCEGNRAGRCLHWARVRFRATRRHLRSDQRRTGRRARPPWGG
jgi:class 3 adenylate cyclase